MEVKKIYQKESYNCIWKAQGKLRIITKSTGKHAVNERKIFQTKIVFMSKGQAAGWKYNSTYFKHYYFVENSIFGLPQKSNTNIFGTKY